MLAGEYKRQQEEVESLVQVVNNLSAAVEHGVYSLIPAQVSTYNLCFDILNPEDNTVVKRHIILNNVSRRIIYYALVSYLRMGIIEGVFEHDYTKNS